MMALGLVLLAPTACVGPSTASDGSVATDATDVMDAPRSDISAGVPSASAENAENAPRVGGRAEHLSAAALGGSDLGTTAAVTCPAGQIDCGGACFPTTTCSAGVGACARSATSTCATLGVAVGAGNQFSCALVSGGTVQCWGDNTFGQLGDRTNASKVSPVAVLTGSTGTTALSSVTQIALGFQHACARISDGTVRCWGLNNLGQLGDRSALNRNVPVTVYTGTTGTTPLSNVVQVSAGRYTTCAVLGDGAVQCWGENVFGQLGDGTFTPRATPVTVLSGPSTPLSGAVEVSVGTRHACARLSSGAVWCWGSGISGQLGDGAATTRTMAVATPVVGATQLSAGELHTCALIAGGTVQCWGDNSAGQLGDGSTTQRNSPVAVSGLASATQLAASFYRSCAALSTGELRCWGNGSTTPGTISGVSAATQVALGWGHSCVRSLGGVVSCAGAGASGALGNGTTTDSATLVTVTGLAGASPPASCRPELPPPRCATTSTTTATASSTTDSRRPRALQRHWGPASPPRPRNA